MNSFFKELFEYTHHCNQQLIDAITSNADRLPEKCIVLQSHVLNAHHVWNNRILSQEVLYGVWQLHPIQEWNDINVKNYENTLAILDTRDLNEIVIYKNTKGQEFSSSIRDMLFQVINHSTYHRGQIATAFRQSGVEPLATDYIFYKR